MATVIKDGSGNGYTQKIDRNNRAQVFAIVLDDRENATDLGDAYNINTGKIALTSSTESAVLFFKNGESKNNGESDIHIESVIVGLEDTSTTTHNQNVANFTIVANPTAGTIVTNAVAVDSKANRNLGSSNTLSSDTLAYKGVEGDTFADGTTWGVFDANFDARSVIPVDLTLPAGSAIGIKADCGVTASNTQVYVVLVLHRVQAQ
jgi:hypothetical protein